MALFKCKMCGAELKIQGDETVLICEHCDTKQTMPRLDNERRANLYDRANHFRRNNEFDKAASIYEQILNEDKTDAEAYWSLVLCRYGIEYVEDPASRRRIPTVNRVQYTSVFDDANYKSALQYAALDQRALYEKDAAAINEVQKGFLAVSQKEEPFDVFICYKETDRNGRRTPDSVLANELYHQLTQEGFKVFFARITLEDKLGSAYEPYIFAALNSAKVMVVLGTRPEYFQAVWVRNEWSRYLSLIRQGQKKMLIPAYKDMDPYDLPEEFSHLQAQDMSKLGFMQDLIRGIKKIMQTDQPKPTASGTTENTAGNASVTPLLKRVFIFLEDGDWKSANEYCEKVLDMDPENALAYVGKLMAELRVSKADALKDQAEPFESSSNYQKALRYADSSLKASLTGCISYIKTRNEKARLEEAYEKAKGYMMFAGTEEAYLELARTFDALGTYKESAVLAERCREKASQAKLAKLEDDYNRAQKMISTAKTVMSLKEAERLLAALGNYKDSAGLLRICHQRADEIKKNDVYSSAKTSMAKCTISGYEEAIRLFRSIPAWNDSEMQIRVCESMIEDLKREEAARKLEKEREEERLRKAAEREAKRKKARTAVTVFVILAAVVFVILLKPVILPNVAYHQAMKLLEEGNVGEAYVQLIALKGFKDSAEQAEDVFDEYKALQLKNAKPGDYVYFGQYEQDNDTSNGKEDVEWLVLDVKDGKALVISKYCLDAQLFSELVIDGPAVTWESSGLRSWLGNEFLNDAFNAEEQSKILTVTVPADPNPNYDTDPGNPTQDRVFVLSVAEANTYFGSDEERECKATAFVYEKSKAYAEENGRFYPAKSNEFDDWWTRTVGIDKNDIVCVDGDGGIDKSNLAGRLYWEFYSVRPAMWIDLNG